MKLQKNTAAPIETLDMCELDDEGFIEGDIDLGTPIASFSFGGSLEQPKQLAANTNLFNNAQKGFGLTPAINGEAFSLKRGYQFRPSTLRKLLELKAKHSDVNVYLNTVLDEAINFYYDYVFGKDSC